MTIRAFEAQASWLPDVVGMRCSAVETDGAMMMSLHFGKTSEDEDGVVSAERTITLEGAWRVERASEVITASADPDDEREEFLAELLEKTLERFEVSRPGYDLTLMFHDALVVRCFPIDSMEYADDVEDPEDVEVSWWVTGEGIPDGWETPKTA